MLDCSKKSYPSQWAAERALHAIQDAYRSHGRKAPTGSYWCGLCKAWHLTSKSKSRKSELVQNETISRPRGTGVGSRGGMTPSSGSSLPKK